MAEPAAGRPLLGVSHSEIPAPLFLLPVPSLSLAGVQADWYTVGVRNPILSSSRAISPISSFNLNIGKDVSFPKYLELHTVYKPHGMPRLKDDAPPKLRTGKKIPYQKKYQNLLPLANSYLRYQTKNPKMSVKLQKCKCLKKTIGIITEKRYY